MACFVICCRGECTDKKSYQRLSGTNEEKTSFYFLASLLAGLVVTSIPSPMNDSRTQLIDYSKKASNLYIKRKLFRAEGLRRVFCGWTPTCAPCSSNNCDIGIVGGAQATVLRLKTGGEDRMMHRRSKVVACRIILPRIH